jgi:TolB protein
MLSMEARRDGPGRPFGEYYHQTPTHIWAYDLDRGELTELANKDRIAPFYTPQLLLKNERILVQVVQKSHCQVMNMNLDGTDAREFTGIDEGMPYGMSLSPDGNRVAFHLAGPRGYEIWTSDVFGGNRVLVAGSPDHLYFGPSWSPDGQWLVYQDCQFKSDPGHDWSDVCIGRPVGGEHRVLTEGQTAWFCASYGPKDNHGGGSNTPSWTRDGKILFPRRTPTAKVAWEFQDNRPDTDHFNRDFKPESAKGGTEICAISPDDYATTRLTHSDPPVWDFRTAESPDGGRIAFCRCATGESPALWIMDRDGGNQRMLTRGLDDKGADFPRWSPASGKK